MSLHVSCSIYQLEKMDFRAQSDGKWQIGAVGSSQSFS